MVNSNETSRIGQRMYGECASQLHRAVRRIRCSFFWGAHCDNEQKKIKDGGREVDSVGCKGYMPEGSQKGKTGGKTKQREKHR